MKKTANLIPSHWLRASILLLLVGVQCLALVSQDEKKKARLSLGFSNTNNASPSLVATIKTKVDRSYERVSGVAVRFYQGAKEDGAFLGKAVSGKDGTATFLLPEDVRDSLIGPGSFLFTAAIENDKRFRDKEKDLEFKRAKTELTFRIEEGKRYVQYEVTAPDSSGEYRPVEDVEAQIYVKRMFGLLPVSESYESTDSEGRLTVEFPEDLPGDGEGYVTIIGKIEDHDDYGTLVNARKIAWGLPLQEEAKEVKRELWSARANAPIPLVIVVNVILLGIWGLFVYILIQLFKIRKLGRTSINEA